MIRLADESVCVSREASDIARGPLRPVPEAVPHAFVSVAETDEFVKGHRQWEALCFVPKCLTVYKNGDRSRVEKVATDHVFMHRCLHGDLQGEFYLALQRLYTSVMAYDLVLRNGRPVVERAA